MNFSLSFIYRFKVGAGRQKCFSQQKDFTTKNSFQCSETRSQKLLTFMVNLEMSTTRTWGSHSDIVCGC